MVSMQCIQVSLVIFAGAYLPATEPGYRPPQGGGIYANATDFRQGKLTNTVSCQSRKDRIRINDFWKKPYVTVFNKGEKHTFQKEAIFGVRDCDGNDYRFFGSKLYQVQEVKSVVIYRQIRLGPNPGVGGSRRVQPITRYYFSTDLTEPIKPLTKTALKQAFPTNYRFHTLLDVQFHREQDDLSVYDSFHTMYTVNWLFQASLEKYF